MVVKLVPFISNNNSNLEKSTALQRAPPSKEYRRPKSTALQRVPPSKEHRPPRGTALQGNTIPTKSKSFFKEHLLETFPNQVLFLRWGRCCIIDVILWNIVNVICWVASSVIKNWNVQISVYRIFLEKNVLRYISILIFIS